MEAETKNETIKWNYDTRPNYGCFAIALSWFTFTVLSRSIDYLELRPKAQTQTPKLAWKWRNRLVSFIHASASSSCAMFCLYMNPDMIEDPITRYSDMSQYLLAFTLGYFIHDSLDLLLNDRTARAIEVHAHHIVISICFMVAILTRNYIGLGTISLIGEFSSVFLGSRQLLQSLGVSKLDRWYRFNGVINLLTFIVCRILVQCWMVRWTVLNRASVPLKFYVLGCASLAGSLSMNGLLFYRLLRADFISAKDSKDYDSHSKKMS